MRCIPYVFNHDLSEGPLSKEIKIPKTARLVDLIIESNVEINESVHIFLKQKFSEALYPISIDKKTMVKEKVYIFGRPYTPVFYGGELLNITMTSLGKVGRLSIRMSIEDLS